MSLYASGVIRIISEPQLKTFESGNMVCNFAGGIREGKDKEGKYIDNAIDVEVWGSGAEAIMNYLKKGDSLFATGAIRRQSWEDSKTNEKRYKHTFNVARFEFLPKPSESPSAAPTVSEEEVPF